MKTLIKNSILIGSIAATTPVFAEVSVNTRVELLDWESNGISGQLGGLPFGFGLSYRGENYVSGLSYRYGSFSLNPDKAWEDNYEILNDKNSNGSRLDFDTSLGRFINKNLLVFGQLNSSKKIADLRYVPKNGTTGLETVIDFEESAYNVGVGVAYVKPISIYFAAAGSLSMCMSINMHKSRTTSSADELLNKTYTGIGPCGVAEANIIVSFNRYFGIVGSLRRSYTRYFDDTNENWYSSDFGAGATVFFRFI